MPLGTIPVLLGIVVAVAIPLLWRKANRGGLARGVLFAAAVCGAVVLIVFGVWVIIVAGEGCC